MILRMLSIAGWHIEFYFTESEYNHDLILGRLYEFGASPKTLYYVSDMMDACLKNRGYTFINKDDRLAIVIMGPSDGSESYLDSLIYEIKRLLSCMLDESDSNYSDNAYYLSDSAKDFLKTVVHVSGITSL